MSEDVRLCKLMAQKGLCSRREADELIRQGLVKVDGVVVSTLGQKVSPEAEIELLANAQSWLQSKVTILFNKPLGLVSSQPEEDYKSAIDVLSHRNQDKTFLGPPFSYDMLKGLAPAGRLDIDSRGLLILTQDGVLAKQIIGENSDIEKEYIVRVIGTVDEEKLQLLRCGMELDGRKLKDAKVELLQRELIKFELKEGRKRQIRRMCENVDLKVTGLKRVRIGNVKLAGLKEGQWRYLQKNEAF